MSIYRKSKVHRTLRELFAAIADNGPPRGFVGNPDLGFRDGRDGHPVPKVRPPGAFLSCPDKLHGVDLRKPTRSWKEYRDHQPKGMGRDGRFTDRRIPWWVLRCVEPSTEPPTLPDPTLPDPEPNLEI